MVIIIANEKGLIINNVDKINTGNISTRVSHNILSVSVISNIQRSRYNTSKLKCLIPYLNVQFNKCFTMSYIWLHGWIIELLTLADACISQWGGKTYNIAHLLVTELSPKSMFTFIDRMQMNALLTINQIISENKYFIEVFVFSSFCSVANGFTPQVVHSRL